MSSQSSPLSDFDQQQPVQQSSSSLSDFDTPAAPAAAAPTPTISAPPKQHSESFLQRIGILPSDEQLQAAPKTGEGGPTLGSPTDVVNTVTGVNAYKNATAKRGQAIAARHPEMQQMTPEQAQAHEQDESAAAHADPLGVLREKAAAAGAETGRQAAIGGTGAAIEGQGGFAQEGEAIDPESGLPLPRTEEYTPQVQEKFTKEYPKTAGVVGGTGAFAGSLVTDPATYTLMSLGPESRFGRALMSAGFGAQMTTGAVQSAGQLGAIWDREDIPEEKKVEMATQTILGAVMAAAATKHGLKETHGIYQEYLKAVPEPARTQVEQQVEQRINQAKDQAPEEAQAVQWNKTPATEEPYPLEADESESPAAKEALRKSMAGEPLTQEETSLSERQGQRLGKLVNLPPADAGSLDDKDFRRWESVRAKEEITNGQDLFELVSASIHRGDIGRAEGWLKRVEFADEDNAPAEEKDAVKKRNEELAKDVKDAQGLVDMAKRATPEKIDELRKRAASRQRPIQSAERPSGDIFDQAKPTASPLSDFDQKPARNQQYRLPRRAVADEVPEPVQAPNVRSVEIDGKHYAYDPRKINEDGVKAAVDKGELWKLQGKKAPEAVQQQAEADVRGEELQAPTPAPDQSAPGTETSVAPQGSQESTEKPAYTGPERRSSQQKPASPLSSSRIPEFRRELLTETDPAKRADLEEAIAREQAIAEGKPFTRSEEQGLPPLSEVKRVPEDAAVPPKGIPARGEAGAISTGLLKFDPKRFQYKLNTNEKGVTNALEGRKFNPELAGQISVWMDPEDGNVYVINGHHRAQLAIESKYPKIQAWHIDVPDATSARARGALQNIAEGSGTSVDAAKFFRDSGMSLDDLEKHGITLTAAKAKEGLALARLTPFLFDKVVSQELPTARAVAIGEATGDHAQQEAIWKLVEKQEAKGRKVTNDTVAELARFVASSGNRTVEQGGLFGANQEIHSLALEKAEVSSYIKQQIAKERRAFSAVSSEERAGTLGRVEGQQIKAGENKKIAEAAAQAEEAYNRLSSRSGPVHDALENAARELSSGNYRPEEVKQRAYAAVREEIRKALSGTEGRGAEGLQKAAGPGKSDEENPSLSLEHPAPTFFSKAEKVAEEKLPKNVSARSVISTLKNAGVKDEEIKWLGLDDWLKDKGLVPKQKLLDFIRENNVQVQEVEKSDRDVKPLSWMETKSGYGNPMWVTNAGRTDYFIVQNKSGQYLLNRGNTDLGSHDTLEEAQAEAHRDAASKRGGTTKFSNYQLPGGSNYRELLLTLPEKESAFDPSKVRIERNRQSVTQGSTTLYYDGKKLQSYGDDPQLQPGGRYEQRPESYWMDVARRLYDQGDEINGVKQQGNSFRSSHFDEPNVLAHVRFNDRISPDGKKTLFIEEVQSDWHQKGRKEGYAPDTSKWTAIATTPLIKREYVGSDRYEVHSFPRFEVRDENGNVVSTEQAATAERAIKVAAQSKKGVPNAPFKSTWHELAMKRMLRYAAENGYDRVAWTTGEQQAARYDLSKQVDSIKAIPVGKENDTRYQIEAFKDGRSVIVERDVKPEDLPNLVGKDLARKIVEGATVQQPKKGEQITVWHQGELVTGRFTGTKEFPGVGTGFRIERPNGSAFYATKDDLNTHVYQGKDLQVGGQGMRAFYDKILPDFMNKYGKKWGGKVGESQIEAPTKDVAHKRYAIRNRDGGIAAQYETRDQAERQAQRLNDPREFPGAMAPFTVEDSFPESQRKVHSLDITPSMKDSVLYEGQPLFNLRKDDLLSWSQAAGRRVKVEEMGDQGGLFGGSEKMYRLSTSKQNSVAVSQAELDELVKTVPAVARAAGITAVRPDRVSFDYTPPEPGSLFSSEKPPVLVLSRPARDLMVDAGGVRDRFNGGNFSAQNVRKIAARLNGSMEPMGEIPEDQRMDAIRLSEALQKAAEESGKAGIKLLLEGSPEHVSHEEDFHAMQRVLGEGEVGEHLPADAIDRLLNHPAAKELEGSLKRMGYSEDTPPQFKVAEIAAKIATAQHDISDRQAADWFVNYVDELHKYHGEGNVATAFANLYDGARDLYEQAKAGQAGTHERLTGAGEAGLQSPSERLPEYATGPPEESRGRGNKETPQRPAAQGELDQPFLLSREQEDKDRERGSSTTAATPIPALISSAGGVIQKGRELYHGAVDKLLNAVHMGQTRPEIRQFDPDAADLATKMDAGGQYHKAVADTIGKKVTGPLTEEFSKGDNFAEREKKNKISRDRMKGFFFLADAQNREYAEEHHPEDFHRWEQDPKIKEALEAYKPFEDQLRGAVKQLGGKTIDEDYIKRIMDFATSGVAYEEKPQGEGPAALRRGATAVGGAGRDNVVSPQIDRSKSRKDQGEFYWNHGVFDFGPSFEKRWIEVMSKLDEHRLAVHAMSMGTRIKPNEALPDKVFYNGQEFYRADIAKEIKDVQRRGVSSESKALADALGVSELPTPKDVREYSVYEPLRRGSRFENAARSLAQNVLAGKEDLAGQAANVNRMAQLRYALPKEIVEALNDAGREKEQGAMARMATKVLAPLTQFIRQQIVGLGYGIPHMANILRKVVQAHPGASLNPMAWADAFKVAFSKELKARGIQGTDDPTYDMLLRNAAVSEGAIPEYKRYIEGNLASRNWEEVAKTVGNAFKTGGREAGKVTPKSAIAGVGRLAIEPLNRFSEAGHNNLFKPGGIDQRARLWLADFLKDRYPEMKEGDIAHEVNQTLGRYNRASWTDVQKGLAPFMLFPGWDYSSITYALKHPFKTAIAPALLMLLANSAVRAIGGNKRDDSKDLERVHAGKYSFRANLLNDNMGSHLWGWALRGATAALQGKHRKDVAGEMVRGLPGDVSGVSVGTLNPIISTPIALGMNRVSPGRQQEIIQKGDLKKKGKVFPSKAADDVADFAARRLFPIYDRGTQAGQRPSLASFAGTVGVSVGEKKKKRR